MWSKTYDGQTFSVLRNVENGGRSYQATSDDVSAVLRIEYTPIRSDGAWAWLGCGMVW